MSRGEAVDGKLHRVVPRSTTSQGEGEGLHVGEIEGKAYGGDARFL